MSNAKAQNSNDKKKHEPIKGVKGTQDIFPKEYYRRTEVFKAIQECFESYGYQGMDVPIIEPLELHLRKSGDKIVKSMYTFKDYGNRDICLRPEITASVVRAFNEGLSNESRPVKIYYFGPTFRYDKPQEGRFRQFTQAGVEIIGSNSLEHDAEVIKLACDCMEKIGIKNYEIAISDVEILFTIFKKLAIPEREKSLLIGALEDLNKLKDIKSGIPDVKKKLIELGISKDETESEEGKYFRILEAIVELSTIRGTPDYVFPKIESLLRKYIDDLTVLKPLENLKIVSSCLDSFGINWQKARIDFGFGRGLEYYTGTIFEIYCPRLGAANQVCGGGRYDELLSLLGGRGDSQSIGFAFGFERLLLAIEREEENKEDSAYHGNLKTSNLDALVIPLDKKLFRYAIKISQTLRVRGAKLDIDFSLRKSGKITKKADQLKIPFVIYIGEEEEKQGFLSIKDLKSGIQEKYPLNDIEKIIEKISDR